MRNKYNKIRFILLITKYLTFKKILNFGKIAISYLFSFFGIQKYTNCKPFFLSIEVANYCNLHCPECPVGTRQISKADMKTVDLSLYKRLVDEMKPTLAHLILYFQGEPLLNKQLPTLIEYAHKAGIFTSTSTNGQLLTKDYAKLLVESGLDKLIVSVDGATQEIYEKYRKGGKLDKVLNGIGYLDFWKKEMNSITPIIEIQFLVLKTNEHQMADMRKLSKSMNADRLAFKTAQLYDFDYGSERMTTLKRYSRYKQEKTGKYVLKANQANRCFRLWSGGVVNAKGEVLPCCYDKMSEFSFGNMVDKDYSACRQSDNASDFRKSILQNRKQYEICRNCTG